jgi:hypothetical protein
MSFEDDLAADVDPDWLNVDIQLNGKPYTFRFTAMNGLDWATECDRHPARPGVKLDLQYGYNLRSIAEAVAPVCGVRVVGDPLGEETEALSAEQWETLLGKADGQTYRHLTDAIWAVNEYLPAQAVVAAKKALAAPKTPSSSRSKSASPRGASSGGSQKKPPSTSTTTRDDSPAQ